MGNSWWPPTVHWLHTKEGKTCQATNGGPGLAATGIYLMRIQLIEEYKSESLVEIHCSGCFLKAKDDENTSSV